MSILPSLFSDPVLTAIRQSLFGQGTIGEEGEDCDTSVYNVQLEVEELQDLDADFGEMNTSVGGASDDDSPCKTPTNKQQQQQEEQEFIGETEK